MHFILKLKTIDIKAHNNYNDTHTQRASMHACCEHYSCVCGCMSVEEAGAGERAENVRARFFTYLFYIY